MTTKQRLREQIAEEQSAEREERFRRADEQLAQAYRGYPLLMLLHDWGCNITGRSREILRREFERRGIDPPLRRSDSHTGGVR